jgi:hypothetical protein
MSLYLEWLARVLPPVANAVFANAVANTSSAINLVPTYQFTQNGAVQSYGPALLRVQAQSNDIFINFGGSGVAVNSAATSGNTVGSYLPAGQDREFEINPNNANHQFMAVSCLNGATNTATVRWWIVSVPKSSTNFGA